MMDLSSDDSFMDEDSATLTPSPNSSHKTSDSDSMEKTPTTTMHMRSLLLDIMDRANETRDLLQEGQPLANDFTADELKIFDTKFEEWRQDTQDIHSDGPEEDIKYAIVRHLSIKLKEHTEEAHVKLIQHMCNEKMHSYTLLYLASLDDFQTLQHSNTREECMIPAPGSQRITEEISKYLDEMEGPKQWLTNNPRFLDSELFPHLLAYMESLPYHEFKEAWTQWAYISAEVDIEEKIKKITELQRYAHNTVSKSIGSRTLLILEGKCDSKGRLVGTTE